MAPTKRKKPTEQAWIQIGLKRKNWEDMLNLITYDLTEAENEVGLKGPFGNPDAWEHWYTVYLEVRLHERYWEPMTTKNFRRDNKVIDKIMRQLIQDIATKIRNEAAEAAARKEPRMPGEWATPFGKAPLTGNRFGSLADIDGCSPEGKFGEGFWTKPDDSKGEVLGGRQASKGKAVERSAHFTVDKKHPLDHAPPSTLDSRRTSTTQTITDDSPVDARNNCFPSTTEPPGPPDTCEDASVSLRLLPNGRQGITSQLKPDGEPHHVVESSALNQPEHVLDTNMAASAAAAYNPPSSMLGETLDGAFSQTSHEAAKRGELRPFKLPPRPTTGETGQVSYLTVSADIDLNITQSSAQHPEYTDEGEMPISKRQKTQHSSNGTARKSSSEAPAEVGEISGPPEMSLSLRKTLMETEESPGLPELSPSPMKEIQFSNMTPVVQLRQQEDIPAMIFVTRGMNTTAGKQFVIRFLYSSYQPTLGDFLRTLHTRHRLAADEHITRLRLVIDGDTMEIEIGMPQGSWDWALAMGMWENKRGKIKATFRAISEPANGGIVGPIPETPL